ncbi:MAG: hypothetical protein Q8S55_04340 [Methylococcaceae bacterium]|nr:hypothetical protein [Methylococcaceae bacterium]
MNEKLFSEIRSCCSATVTESAKPSQKKKNGSPWMLIDVRLVVTWQQEYAVASPNAY